MKKLFFNVLFLILVLSFNGKSQELAFESTPESLKRHKCPEWFRDAKFGIWAHWGPQSVPMQGDWYARQMYVQGTGKNLYHVKNYGHPSKFGYKDIIELFKPDKLDFDRLMGLYKQAGAKYAVILAVHHDNFDLWDSKYHEWNSVNKGPKRDLVGEFRTAALNHGLRFGVSQHNSRSYSWFQTNKGADSEGPMKGIPYDGNDPNYEALYHPHSDDKNFATPLDPPKAWRDNWLARTKDLIDKYHPDHMYFDGAIPFYGEDKGKTGMELISYYYNKNMEWNNGKLEGVLCTKWIENHGILIKGATMLDIEGGSASGIEKEPWQTDMSLGDWFYQTGRKYQTVECIIRTLVDIVSKNGNLLLNIPMKPDGTLDASGEAFLNDMGEWMTINGEALYGTRPWLVFGEGPSLNDKVSQDVIYKTGDLRFAARGNNELSVFLLNWPQNNRLVIRSLAKTTDSKANVEKVEMYGQQGTCKFRQTAEGLEVVLPEKKSCNYVWTLKVTGENLLDFNPIRADKK